MRESRTNRIHRTKKRKPKTRRSLNINYSSSQFQSSKKLEEEIARLTKRVNSLETERNEQEKEFRETQIQKRTRKSERTSSDTIEIDKSDLELLFFLSTQIKKQVYINSQTESTKTQEFYGPKSTDTWSNRKKLKEMEKNLKETSHFLEEFRVSKVSSQKRKIAKTSTKIHGKSKLEILRLEGIERYCLGLEKKMMILKMEKKKISDLYEVIKEQIDNPELIESLRDSLKFKDQVIDELRTQITKLSKTSYSAGTGSKISEICARQLKEIETLKRENSEWRRRHTSRTLNYHQLEEDKKTAENEANQLKNIIGRQMKDISSLISQKSKKLKLYMDRIKEFSSCYSSDIVIEKQQENRKKAAEFLVSQLLSKSEEVDRLKIESLERSGKLESVIGENNRLKLEINGLKDEQEYSKSAKYLQKLKNEILTFQKECRVEKSIKLQKTIENTQKRIQKEMEYSKSIEAKLKEYMVSQKRKLKAHKLIMEDHVISFLEKELKEVKKKEQKRAKLQIPDEGDVNHDSFLEEKLIRRNASLKYLLDTRKKKKKKEEKEQKIETETEETGTDEDIETEEEIGNGNGNTSISYLKKTNMQLKKELIEDHQL